MLKKCHCLFLFLFVCLHYGAFAQMANDSTRACLFGATSQGKNSREELHLGARLGYNVGFKGENTAELGLAWIFFKRRMGNPAYVAPLGYWGLSTTVEGTMLEDKLLIAPRIGIEGHFLLISTRLTAACYLKEGKQDYRFSPEIGVGLFGFVVTYASWNIPLQATTIEEVSPFRLAIAVNLFTF